MPNRPLPPTGEIVLYQTDDGRTRVECRFADETLWLSQALIADLFQVTVPTVNEHLKNLFDEGEVPISTIRNFRIVRREGARDVARDIEHYSLDAILAVGYRIRSERGTQFRRWATERLREYLVKGFTMDDLRLQNPPVEGSGVPDYFDELLERIRDIRASERRMYLRVREIFALAGDYDPNRRQTAEFFQTIQNKLHFAATGLTAPELIAGRANHAKSNMGLTAWKGKVVRKGDVTVAKNYLNRDEIGDLNRIVTMWLDFAEDQARRRKQVFLKDWDTKLDDFLRFNERAVLQHKGNVSKSEADTRAAAEYEEFAARRRALLEAEGEDLQMRALEDAAEKLPNRPKRSPRR
ncbi:MAG: virulence RhuM family protein [Bryobacteraceae bacterium]